MTTRPFIEYDPLALSSSTPSLSSLPESSVNDSNQLPFTPPPSLPTSSPGSPEQHSRKGLRGGGGKGGERSRSSKMTPFKSLDGSGKRAGKMRADFTNHVEVSVLPEGEGDEGAVPILPKTFPAVFSEDSADDEAGAKEARRREKGSKKTPRKRVVSQERITTTTTTSTLTRKLEKNKNRYSTSILDEMNDDEALNHFRSLPRARSESPQQQGEWISPGFVASSTTPVPRRRRRPSTASPRRSSSRHLHKKATRSSSPSTSRHRSHTQIRRRKSSSSSASSPFHSSALVLRSRPLQDPVSDFSPYTFHDEDDHNYPLYPSPLPHPFPSSFPSNSSGSIPLFRPVINLFTFFLVSSFCCFTVSAVLVTSFSLTFYDDCTRRLSGLNRSLRTGRRSIEGGFEGVREGVERVLGSAKGKVENAVKDKATGSSGRTRGGKRTTMPIVSEVKSEEEESEMMGKGNARSLEGGGFRIRPSSSGPNSPRRNLNPSSSSSVSPRHSLASTSESTHKSGWATDEDALPFEVPHLTPFTSRPVSPHRSPPRSRQPTSSEAPHSKRHASPSPPRATPSSTSSSSLPPRPHLAVLLPSLFFAVVLTLAKLGYSFYTAREKEKQRIQKEEEEEVRRWEHVHQQQQQQQQRGRRGRSPAFTY
ncbi:uncharacterized protein JCM6883_006689 [Sporobolomyces salmoneus]|uniref:uncharacterized protein n=1 Tax=Sporobolomyces salmoneus TaxID=183962 RepID=UPI00317D28A6